MQVYLFLVGFVIVSIAVIVASLIVAGAIRDQKGESELVINCGGYLPVELSVTRDSEQDGPVYPEVDGVEHKVKDELSAILDLVEPSDVRLPNETEEHLAGRIIEAYEHAYKIDALPYCDTRYEYACAIRNLYKAHGQIFYEDFRVRPPKADAETGSARRKKEPLPFEK